MKKSQIVGIIFLLLAIAGLFDPDNWRSTNALGGAAFLAFIGLMLISGFWESEKKEKDDK